jgi:hypothetical protein
VATAKKKADTPPVPLPDLDTEDGRWELMRRASKGDAAAVPLVRKAIDRDTREGGNILEAYGDMALHAAHRMAKFVAGDDAAVEAGLLRKLRALREELAGPSPSPVERILCERVALCWLDVNEMDRRFIEHSGSTYQEAAYREARRDRAHKRFLAACKALATVRRLGGPAVQINQVVGRQEVNVGTSP